MAELGQNATLRYHLGMAYAQNNNPFGAKQELTKAFEIATDGFPGSDEARATLAQMETS